LRSKGGNKNRPQQEKARSSELWRPGIWRREFNS